MANIISNWVLIENNLIFFYGLLMGAYHEVRPDFAPPTHPVARQVFSVIESLNARLELVEELCKWKAPEEGQAFADFRTAVRRVGSGRHLVAHGHWNVCDKYPNDLVLLPLYGLPIRYTIKDFEVINTRILDSNRELGDIMMRVYEKRSQNL